MVSDVQLAGRRARYTARLRDSCTVSTPSTNEPTPDGAGGWTEAAPTTQTLACGYRIVSAREAGLSGGILKVGDFVVRLPANSNVSERATIVIAARGSALQHTLSVKGVLHQSDEIGTEVLASEG